MLSKCANPKCSAPFQYLHDGKLFEVEAARISEDVTLPKPPHKIERFWLCANCAATMTVAVTPDKRIRIIPLAWARSAAAS